MNVISRIVFKVRPTGLFLAGNFVVVFGNDTQMTKQDFYKGFRRQNPFTFFKVFDLSNPANPQLVRDLSLEGSYREARLAGSYIYFITDARSSYVAGESPAPRVVDSGQVLPSRCDQATKCFAPDIYYFDAPYSASHLANVTMINVQNNSEPLSGQSYLLDSNQSIQLAANNLYISYSPAVSEYDLQRQAQREIIYPKLSSTDQEKINNIEATPQFILSSSEQKIKVAQVISDYLAGLGASDRLAVSSQVDASFQQKLSAAWSQANKTVLYKFVLDNNKLDYSAKGEVKGQLLNALSLDEAGNYLRVGTVQAGQSATSQTTDFYSSVYILDSSLKLVGSLENLATTDRIADMRFIGNRAYLISAKADDPLFVINLSDATKPTVAGALKISGTAHYLYPVNADGTKLLSLGYDQEGEASTSLKVTGLKLSLYDFSDLSKPKEVDSHVVPDVGTDSAAFYDHSAFFYSADQNLLAFPAILHDSKGRLSFAGSLVFSLLNDKLQLKGKIDHSAGGHFGQLDSWAGVDYYDNTVKRSWLANDNLFSLSNKFLKVTGLVDWKELKSLELTTRGDDYLPVQSGSPAPATTTTANASGNDAAAGTAAASNQAASTTTGLTPNASFSQP
jgi:uncharacterized secreted protein with C-terminal beta-propeller domain